MTNRKTEHQIRKFCVNWRVIYAYELYLQQTDTRQSDGINNIFRYIVDNMRTVSCVTITWIFNFFSFFKGYF